MKSIGSIHLYEVNICKLNRYTKICTTAIIDGKTGPDEQHINTCVDNNKQTLILYSRLTNS